MEKANIFVSIRSLDSTQLGCKFDDYDYVLRALRADYPDYTLTDLMMVCKIERLYKRGFIEKDRYDQLIDLYDLRVKTEDKFYEIFGRLFAKGSYSLTPKINIYGAAAVSFCDYYSNNKTSFSGYFGADYKITEKSTISIAVSVRKGNHPLMPEYGLYPMAPTTFSPMFQNELFAR